MNFGQSNIIQECFLAFKFAKSKPIAEPDHTLESSDARSLLQLDKFDTTGFEQWD